MLSSRILIIEKFTHLRVPLVLLEAPNSEPARLGDRTELRCEGFEDFARLRVGEGQVSFLQHLKTCCTSALVVRPL